MLERPDPAAASPQFDQRATLSDGPLDNDRLKTNPLSVIAPAGKKDAHGFCARVANDFSHRDGLDLGIYAHPKLTDAAQQKAENVCGLIPPVRARAGPFDERQNVGPDQRYLVGRNAD